MNAVLIDGYAFSDGSQYRGIGTFLHHLVAGLTEQQDLSVRVLARRDTALPPGAELVRMRRVAPRRAQRAEHDWLLPRMLNHRQADVFHSPSQHPPQRSGVPWVQTLHDVIPLTRPHPLLAREGKRWIRLSERIRRADAIAAVSRFSADEGLRHLGLDTSRLHVIPLGVDPAIFSPSRGPRADVRPYLLHVGGWGPHKGHAEAVAVHTRLSDLGYEHRLTLAGRQDAWMLEKVRRVVATSPYADRIDVVGHVADLAELYREAVALLFTSRCEGFGLPALEAMACGTAVVAFQNSAVTEVVGDGGLLVPDGDIDSMVRCARMLLDNESTREEYAAAALARSLEFRWSRTAGAYAELFRAIAR